MSRLRVAPIVEGHGEDGSIRILLTRIWGELLGGEYIDVLKPTRISRPKIVHQRKELERAIEFSAIKLRYEPPSPMQSMILLLIDADEDAPCVLGPRLQAEGASAAGEFDLACVIANLEYETWFVAAAASLDRFLRLSDTDEIPALPEAARNRKAWIEQRFRGTKYSPTVDQPAMTAHMDLAVCRARCPSFDKLCRELEKRRGVATG